MRLNSALRKGEFFRLEPGGPWHEVVRVGVNAYVKKLSTGTRTFLVSTRKEKHHGLEYEMPLAEPKKVTVPETSNAFAISAHSFVFDRTMTRPTPEAAEIRDEKAEHLLDTAIEEGS